MFKVLRYWYPGYFKMRLTRLVNGYIECHLAFQRLQRVQSRTKLFALYTKLFPMSSGSLVKTKLVGKVVGRIVRGRMFDSQQYTELHHSSIKISEHAAHKRTAHKRSTQTHSTQTQHAAHKKETRSFCLFACLSLYNKKESRPRQNPLTNGSLFNAQNWHPSTS